MRSSTIVVGNGHDGSFRVIFSDGSKGLFKGCESEKFHFSWKAGNKRKQIFFLSSLLTSLRRLQSTFAHLEIFAYHIDRELAIQRTPASVVRTLLWNDIFALQVQISTLMPNALTIVLLI